MRIALDAMGSDHAPAVEVDGAIRALRELDGDFELVLVGDRETVEAELARYPDAPRHRIAVAHAPERIRMGESPAQAVRRKLDSSIVVGVELQKREEVSAFISAGSTGAVMAASLLMLRPLPGVDRPAVGTVIPTAEKPILLIDAGANVDVRPSHLLQFALLGTTYVQDVMGVGRPRVGLLNIGEEPGKGNELVVDAFPLLAGSPQLNFVGNVEGRDVIRGVCDVLVCDGFVGNVLLKFYESIAGFVAGLLRREAEAVDAGVDLDQIFRRFDYAEYGGAPLLGVNGVTIICHGGSPARAIRNAIRIAVQAVEQGTVANMGARLAPAAPQHHSA